LIAKLILNVRSATEADRPALANMIHFETRVHRHLDWRPPLEWINHPPCLVAEHNGAISSALFCPPDPPEVAWIRLFVVMSGDSVRETWEALWPEALQQLRAPGMVAGAIPLQAWFRTLLEESGFYEAQKIVLLTWNRDEPLPPARPNAPLIRPMTPDDITEVEEIDNRSFGKVWRNSRESIGLAFRQSAISTVAEDDSGLLGYQISTASPMGGHLARLAVLPDRQGQGIGFALTRDLLDEFYRRGAQRVSVNTQENNEISIALYQKLGFHQTGEDYPVYLFNCSD
jgi:ribosomal protein S18 acetylase RimI-like enzyme